MKKVNLNQAKTNLSKLVDLVAKGNHPYDWLLIVQCLAANLTFVIADTSTVKYDLYSSCVLD